ncbi:garvicin Q family class II bacteriocin [Ligilactobacillus agilis]|uniref:garvicin Q family class II bacteriocin n=1 Tax=Ligilactobacillus agilis TaxID=1601 RepID=UPI001CDA7AB4|nr:garvicin Q family class II bacteriocin [Ligilactobacillus agilis]
MRNSGYCEPVYYGANGYSCRYSNGKWDYKVTKIAAQAVGGGMAKGWIGSLGGSYYQPGYWG